MFCKYYNPLSLRDCVQGRTDRRAAAPTRKEDIRTFRCLNRFSLTMLSAVFVVWYTNWKNRGYLAKESIARMPVVEDRWRQLAEQLPIWREQGYDMKKEKKI